MKKACGVLVIVLALIIVGVSGAMAQTKNPVVAQTIFTKIDANGDGSITVAEYAAYWQGRFKNIDSDKDSKLIAAEFEAAVKESFGSMDTDKDNILVAQEHIAYWCGPQAKVPDKKKIKAKKNIDSDKDGKIDNDECAVFWMARFNDMDKNKDNRVTMDEFLTAMKKRFKEIDKNGDGFISIEEHAYFWSAKTASAKKTN